MKSGSNNFLWRLASGGVFPLFVIMLLVSPTVIAQQASYNNSGNISGTPPNVDATNFYNSGIWNIISTPVPYQTKDTLNYYNSSSMTSEIGWNFDFKPASGSPGWSSNFTNDNNGVISAVSGQGSLLQLLPVGYLLVSATNILNKGVLAADPYSQINLTGSSVNLSRSKVVINPITANSSANDNINNVFTASTAVYDQYWGQAGISNINSSVIWNGTNAASPTFKVNEPCDISGVSLAIGIKPNFSDSTSTIIGILPLAVTNINGTVTNIFLPTNIVRQAVFIYCADSNIIGQVRFSPSPIPTNYFDTVAVRLAASFTNFTTLAIQTNAVYLVDTLASTTNRGFFTNTVVNPYAECSDFTYRPANYVFSRSDPGAFADGLPGNGQPTNTYLFEPDFTNRFVDVAYAGYSAYVDNQGAQISNGSSITNLPGRVQIMANNLNLNQTHIRGEGEIIVQASNLVSSTGAVVDSQYLSYNIGATNGFLNVTNLAGPSVSRFYGTVSCFSALWNNTATIITTNYNISTNGPVYSPLTNSVQVGLYVLLVDASQLATVVPVTVQDLVVHSTNIIVSDSMNVAQTLFFDGNNLTLNGDLSLGSSYVGLFDINDFYFNSFAINGGLQNWIYTNAPSLQYFTNNGSLYIPNDAHFGDDGPTNYLVFVNNGSIYSGSQTIDGSNLQINGFDQTSAGNFYGVAQIGQLFGAYIQSAGDIQFFANTLSLNQSTLSANNALNFTVTNSLSDSGSGADNSFTVGNGFNLLIKPLTGDLLGTSITSMALANNEIDHAWAGQDRGVNYAGFTNNVAVGALTLIAQDTTGGDPLFHFYGIGSSNAIYVGYLDLSKIAGSGIDELKSELTIDPGLVIYYANAKLGFALTNITAAQYLNGQTFGGGQLKWIQGFTSKATQLSGNFVNGGTNGSSFQLMLSGIPGQPYIVQASTNLVSATNWVNISTNFGGTFTFPDTNVVNFPERFYRAVPVQ